MTEVFSVDHAEKAAQLFLQGYNCAQAVVCAFCDITELDENTAKCIASSFGGGMGKLRQTCGAVTGAFAVAGLLFGDYDVNDNERKSEHYALVRRIAEEFSSVYEKPENMSCISKQRVPVNTHHTDHCNRHKSYCHKNDSDGNRH